MRCCTFVLRKARQSLIQKCPNKKSKQRYMPGKKKKKGSTKKMIKQQNIVSVNNRIVFGVKFITSRRKPNLRERRMAMPGAGVGMLYNPAFYGNVQGLSESALNTMANARYAAEQVARGRRAEEIAGQAAPQHGRDDAARLRRNYDDLMEAHRALIAQGREHEGGAARQLAPEFTQEESSPQSQYGSPPQSFGGSRRSRSRVADT